MQPLSYIKRKIKKSYIFRGLLCPFALHRGYFCPLYLYYNEKTIVEKLLFLVYTTDKYLYRRWL